MLQKIREKILGWVAIVIIGMIGITFVFWGVTDLRPFTEGTVAVVNGEEVPRREFEQLYRQQIMQFSQMFGGAVPDEIQAELRDRIIDNLIQERVLSQRIRERGYRVPDQWVADSIRGIEAFHGAGGQFSMDIYRSRLAMANMTPDQFERQQRQALAMDLLQDALGESGVYTSSEFRRYIELAYQEREIAWARFPLADFVPQVETPGDEEIRAYYEDNLQAFMRPESVDIEYVELGLDDVAGIMVADEDTLRDYYQRTMQGQGLEQRRARHILIGTDQRDAVEAQALAEALRERIEEGEDFADLAREYSDDPGSGAAGGDLGWAERGVYVEPFEEALFALSVGEVAGPVETIFGYHLILLEDLVEPQVEPFEAVQDEVREQYLRDLAMGAFIDRANQLADAAFEHGDDLAAIARAEGLEVHELEGLTRSGDPRFENPAEVAAAAFSQQVLDEGRVSPLVQTSDEHVMLLRVVQYHPEQPYELEEVADDIRERLREEAAAALAAETADRYLERLREGATPEELQEEFGVELAGPVRQTRQAFNEVPPGVLTSAFAQPRPGENEVIDERLQLADGDYAVYLLSAVLPGDPASVNQFELDLERDRQSMQAGFRDFAMYLRALERSAEIRRPQDALEDFQF